MPRCQLTSPYVFFNVRHQLRVHSALALNCPIAGDAVYGNGTTPWLHAALKTRQVGPFRLAKRKD